MSIPEDSMRSLMRIAEKGRPFSDGRRAHRDFRPPATTMFVDHLSAISPTPGPNPRLVLRPALQQKPKAKSAVRIGKSEWRSTKGRIGSSGRCVLPPAVNLAPGAGPPPCPGSQCTERTKRRPWNLALDGCG